MATTRRTTRSTRTVTRNSGGGGSGYARFLLPLAAVGIGAYLLWPKTANAAPNIGPIPPPLPNPLPPAPMPAGGGVEPVADAPLGEGASRGRITGSNVVVRNGPNDNSAVVSTLPLNAGVAVLIAPETPPTPNAPQGRRLVRTARGVQGYVASQYVRVEAPTGPISAAEAARGAGAPGTAGYFFNGR